MLNLITDEEIAQRKVRVLCECLRVCLREWQIELFLFYPGCA